MWRNFRLLHITDVENSDIFSKSVMWRNFKLLHMTNVEKSDIYPHLSCVCYVENVSKSDKFYADLLQLHSFFFAKSVLLTNLFGYNFCTFAWRKIEPKFVSVEKK